MYAAIATALVEQLHAAVTVLKPFVWKLLAVEGIDVWFIGPNDLAHRMGFPGQGERQEVRDAVRGALATIAAAGRIGGTLATRETAAALEAAGARVLLTRAAELLAFGADSFHALLSGTARGKQ